ncbi:MAG: hypothetical protein CVU09_09890 [Bacteroidetes bacterium HGW-Bacteroidetes-4]|jgi:hypothetical protein|nr:MAG: hypothetical protein CVU09_09890 [Bacteroidetes bacterium HGW-Bacteroidetes-4]
MIKLLKPEIFQGSLRKKKYFEGWYFKQVSADLNQVYAFIPGISLSENDPHSFIQVINGISGETHYVSYPLNQFKWEKKKLHIQVGTSVFCKDYIKLDIANADLTVKGTLHFDGITPYPASIMNPGIMGWYSFVPFMECYHGVVSVNHRLKGELTINNAQIDFNNGKGYIEKDWGTSFPSCWIWLQSNSFKNSEASLFVSVAKIPWLGKFFMGFIAFLYFNGQFFRFSTYNGSKIDKLLFHDDILQIHLAYKNYRLSVQARIKNAGTLIAPSRGSMNRRIKESIDSTVTVKLSTKKGLVVFEESSSRAGLEIIEELFRYF